MALSVATTEVTPTSNNFQGAYSKQLQNIFGSVEDVPQVWQSLFKRYGQLPYMTEFLAMAGYTGNINVLGSVKAASITTLSEGQLQRYITIDTAISTGAANGAITICPDDLDFANSGAQSNCRLKTHDVVLIPAAYQTDGLPHTYKVTAQNTVGVGEDTFTALPFDTSARIGTEVPIGAKIPIITNSHGYGTGQPTALQNGLLSRTHYGKILKGTARVEGGQQPIERYTDTMGNVDWNSQWARAVLEAKRLLDIDWDGAILFSEVNENTSNLVATSNSGGSNAIPSFDGILTAMTARAGLQNYDTSYKIEDLWDIKTFFLAAGVVTNRALFGHGPGMSLQLEKLGLDFLKDYSASDLMKLNTVGASFNAFEANKITFMSKEFITLGDPQRFGADTTFQNYGFIFPDDTTPIQVNGDTVRVPYINLLNVNYKGVNRGLVLANQYGMSGLGEPVVSQYDEDLFYLLSHRVLMLEGLEKSVLVRKAG